MTMDDKISIIISLLIILGCTIELIHSNIKYTHKTIGTIIKYKESHSKYKYTDDVTNKDEIFIATEYIPTVEYTDINGNLVKAELTNEKLNHVMMKKFCSKNNNVKIRYNHLNTQQARIVGGYETTVDVWYIVIISFFMITTLGLIITSILDI
jgi:hypothetical protein